MDDFDKTSSRVTCSEKEEEVKLKELKDLRDSGFEDFLLTLTEDEAPRFSEEHHEAMNLLVTRASELLENDGELFNNGKFLCETLAHSENAYYTALEKYEDYSGEELSYLEILYSKWHFFITSDGKPPRAIVKIMCRVLRDNLKDFSEDERFFIIRLLHDYLDIVIYNLLLKEKGAE